MEEKVGERERGETGYKLVAGFDTRTKKICEGQVDHLLVVTSKLLYKWIERWVAKILATSSLLCY